MTNTVAGKLDRKQDKNWWVIRTKPRHEKSISENLANQKIINYFQLNKQLRQWHDRKKWVSVPLFPGYLFVELRNDEKNKIFEFSGVLSYLSIAGKPATLRKDEIERIERLCSSQKEIIIDKQSLAIGKKVKIISGKLMGLEGMITEAGNKYQFVINVHCIEACIKIWIDKSEVAYCN